MRPVRYRPNPLFEEEVRAQAEHQRGMRKITKGVAASVRVAAPHVTGYYERRVKAQGTRVRALDVFWHLVEFGSANNRPYGPLRRGVRAAGLRFVRRPKP
jgi:hypothetical protein